MSSLRKVGKEERKFLGVCGGISKHLDPKMDPIIIRIIWTILTMFNPIMIPLYFVLAIALNTHDNEITQ